MPERVALGPTDIQISPLGIGAWAWGDRFYWGYGNTYTESDVYDAFGASLSAGINFYDTAEMYGFGQSERLMREAMAIAREPAVIATKFMPFPWRLRKASLRGALRGSLERLGVERVDLYQMHWPLPPVSIERWMDAMADAHDAGLVAAVGVSNYNVGQLRRAHTALTKRGVPLAADQVRYSLIDRSPEATGLLDACRELNVTLIAYSPLGQGLLTGKYSADRPPPGIRQRRGGSARHLAKLQPLIELLRSTGEAHEGKTPGQVALNWLICKGAVPIPGAKNAEQARQNAGALGWRLTGAEVTALDEVSTAVG
jgi:aryl-alcohol dehydrogenase-like predicted oxidoreductase